MRPKRSVESGSSPGMSSRPVVRVRRHRLDAKCVFACGDHGQRHRVTIPAGVHVLGFKPCAQPGIVNFRLALPEIWRQPALDPKVIQLEFNRGHVLGEISPYVVRTNEQPGVSPAFTLRFDDHVAPALQRGIRFSLGSQVTGKPPVDAGTPRCRIPI
jgi:hypothetical protein